MQAHRLTDTHASSGRLRRRPNSKRIGRLVDATALENQYECDYAPARVSVCELALSPAHSHSSVEMAGCK